MDVLISVRMRVDGVSSFCVESQILRRPTYRNKSDSRSAARRRYCRKLRTDIYEEDPRRASKDIGGKVLVPVYVQSLPGGLAALWESDERFRQVEVSPFKFAEIKLINGVI